MEHTVTEEEARSQWCPFSRVDAYPDAETGVTVNRGAGAASSKACLCIASRCMAWRWEPDAGLTDDVPRGFCGLVGSV